MGSRRIRVVYGFTIRDIEEVVPAKYRSPKVATIQNQCPCPDQCPPCP